MEKQFDLNARYEEHMKLCGLDTKKLHPEQNATFKRMFFAGLKNMNDVIGSELPKVASKLERIELIKSLGKQINDFWNNEANVMMLRRQLVGKKPVSKIIKLGKLESDAN